MPHSCGLNAESHRLKSTVDSLKIHKNEEHLDVIKSIQIFVPSTYRIMMTSRKTVFKQYTFTVLDGDTRTDTSH